MKKVILGLPQSNELDEIVREFSEELIKHSIDAEVTQIFTHFGIQRVLESETEVLALVVSEDLELATPITALMLDMLSDNFPNLSIIPILADKHKGQGFMQALLEKGIYNGVFAGDARISFIVDLIAEVRNKRDAKDYYGLFGDVREKSEDVSGNILADSVVTNCIKYLTNANDEELSSAYDYISGKYTDQQNIYLMGKIPKGIVDKLGQNETYRRIKELIDRYTQEKEVPKKKEGTGPAFLKSLVNTGFKVKFQSRAERTNVIAKQVVAFWSPLPRGKTTLAAHSAVYLAKHTKLKVAIADTDPYKPELIRYFPLQPDKGISNALELIQENRADYEHLDRCLTPHPKMERLDILYGHSHIQDFYQSRPEHYQQLLERLLIRRDVLLLDVHSVCDCSSTDAALSMANTVFVPVRADKMDIELVNGYIQDIKAHGDYDIRKFHLVVNEYGHFDMTFTEVEALSILPVAAYIRKNSALQKKPGIDSKLVECISELKLLERR